MDNVFTYDNQCDFTALVGKIVLEVTTTTHYGNDALILKLDDGSYFGQTHRQDCCENVWLADVTGSWDDIIGQKVSSVYENTQTNNSASESGTYSFYTITTFNGAVTLRWCGESNGYYSETVDCFMFRE